MAKSTYRETLKEMKTLAGYMKKMNEDYFMDDEMGGPVDGPETPEQMHVPQGETMQPQQEVDPKAQEDVQKIDHANQVLQQEPIIGKIREIAIDGLKKYSDQPTSENYEFFKSVFLSSDKLLTNKGK